MMRVWFALAIFLSATAGFDDAAAAQGSTVAAENGNGDVDIAGWDGDDKAAVTMEQEGQDAGGVGNADGTAEDNHEEIVLHIEAPGTTADPSDADPKEAEAVTGEAASAPAAEGSGDREEQQEVLNQLGQSTNSLSALKASDSPHTGVAGNASGNSEALANSISSSQGQVGKQHTVLPEKDPLSQLLSLPKAPRALGLKTLVIGLGLLLLALWVAFEEEGSVAYGPSHALDALVDMDSENVSLITFITFLIMAIASLFSSTYRHFSSFRKQQEWIKSAEEAIDAAKGIHEDWLKQISGQQETADMADANVGKSG